MVSLVTARVQAAQYFLCKLPPHNDRGRGRVPGTGLELKTKVKRWFAKVSMCLIAARPYDDSVAYPISRLLTVGSMPV